MAGREPLGALRLGPTLCVGPQVWTLCVLLSCVHRNDAERHGGRSHAERGNEYRAHQKLDAAVFAAYGWQTTLTDDELLARLLELNLAQSKNSETAAKKASSRG